MSAATRDRFRGCLLGLAVGDALGTTVEFSPRGSFEPLTDMVGGGPFSLEPGEWTDDTSMALCLAASLTELGAFDPRDQIDRYVRWYRTGYMSSNGRCFDIGNAIRAALHRYEQTGDPFSGSTSERSAGNGCIMRLAPVPMFFFGDEETAAARSRESSRTTHGAVECLECSDLLSRTLTRALSGADKEEILAPVTAPYESMRVAQITAGTYRHLDSNEVKGSGYVVESLEAAMWCFAHTDSFEEAVLAAANLGDDADTTAAVCGQIAGAHYGAAAIPSRWLERLAKRELIETLADRLFEIPTRPSST